MASAYESLFNVRLAVLLRQQGLEAAAEVQRPGGRRLDVLVDIGGSKVVLEVDMRGCLVRHHLRPCRRDYPGRFQRPAHQLRGVCDAA